MTKESLFWTSQSPKLNRRTTLYYGKYKYCLSFYLKNSRCLRYSLSPEKLAKSINWFMANAGYNNWRWSHPPPGGYNKINVSEPFPTAALTDWQHDLFNVAGLLNSDVDKKIYICTDWVNVYVNELELIRQLEAALNFTKSIAVNEIDLVGSPDLLLVKTVPEHEYRSYFRAAKLTTNNKTALVSYITSQEDVRTSPAVSLWLKKKMLYAENHFFIDHNSLATTQMLSLILPGLVRKTLKIVQDK